MYSEAVGAVLDAIRFCSYFFNSELRLSISLKALAILNSFHTLPARRGRCVLIPALLKPGRQQ